MKSNHMAALVACALVLMLMGGVPSSAQSGNDKPAEKSGKEQPPAPVANPEEDAAFKAFNDVPMTPADSTRKAQLGEDFAKKYPQSRYNVVVYSMLTSLYLNTGQIPKMIESGTRAIELNPNDVQDMAILAQSMPRSLNKDLGERTKQIEKAQEYAKKAIEITPTMPKPSATLTDEAFASAKNVVLAMAHSGLGHIDIMKQKYDEAIKELEEAIKLDSQPDPVNFYLLGIANQQASHFDDAVAAFNKCAAIPGQLQAACKGNAEAAKKLASTQLSAPK
jgi:tetratricopeptide (TPR) repeat protein